MHLDHSNFSLDDNEPAYYVPWVGGCKSHTTQVTKSVACVQIHHNNPTTEGAINRPLQQYSSILTYLFTTFSTLNLIFWWSTFWRYHICPYIVIILPYLSTLMQRYWPRCTARRSSSSCVTSILQGIPKLQFQSHIEVVWRSGDPQTSHFSSVPEVVLEPNFKMSKPYTDSVGDWVVQFIAIQFWTSFCAMGGWR